MTFSSLLLAAQGGLQGLSNTISDLSQTIGVDLFEEDIDNVVFQTNEFLCNPDFIGTQGPFWWILQMSMALGALFSIIVGASIAYKMMVKGEPIDVFKILKVLGIAMVMIFWYPPSMTGMGSGSGSILDALAYIPNCIGSYTHDLYEAEAVQVSEKYNELMPLLQKRDTMYQKAAEVEAAESIVKQDPSIDIMTHTAGGKSAIDGLKDAARAKKTSVFAGLIIGLDKIVMFFSLVLYRVGWWATIFCQQILLGMLTIFGPIQWAFSVLPKWEGAWAKWIIRYLTVHFYGAMLYFVGFYVLLLFDKKFPVSWDHLSKDLLHYLRGFLEK